MARLIRVKVTGKGDLRRKLTTLRRNMRHAAERAAGEELDELAEDMRRHAAVGDARRGRRGRPPLRSSIVTRRDGLDGTARSTAEHARYVEQGTSSHPAQPFAKPAAETSRRRFPKRVRRLIEEQLPK
jgi:HK97 gp10 family phage protein